MRVVSFVSSYVGQIILICCFASSAFAACPTGEDLAAGIQLKRNTPLIENTYFAEGAGTKLVSKRQSAEGLVESVTIKAHPFLVTELINDTPPIIYVYENSFDGIDDSDRQKEWSSPFEFRSLGKVWDTGVVTLSFEDYFSVEIGDCQYDVWVVKEHYAHEKFGHTRFWQYYSPELKISLRSLELDANSKPVRGVEYDTISIVE